MNRHEEMKAFVAKLLEEQTQSILELASEGGISDDSIWELIRSMDLVWEKTFRSLDLDAVVFEDGAPRKTYLHPAVELFVNKMRFQQASV